MATVIPKKGQIVLTKEAFDAKAAAGELIPGAEYLISNIQYATTEELNNTATSLNTEITNTGNRVTEVERQISSIPEWAKQENKPTYTAEEVGALPNTTQYVSSVNGQSGAITGVATTEEVNTAKQSANSYTDTKTGEISTALQQNTTKVNELEQQNTSQSSQIDVLQKLYAVGSIYMSTNSTSPAELFGGTWERIKDRFLLGAGDSYSAGATGGEATHVLTVNEMPQHKHGVLMSQQGGASEFACQSVFSAAKGAYNYADYCANNGDSYPHNNMPPYLAVYVWKRTA